MPRPLTENKQHSKGQTSMPLGGIRAHNPSRRAAADLRHRPPGCWDRPRLMYLGTDIMHIPGTDFASDIKMSNCFSRVLFDTRERFSPWSQVKKSVIFLTKHRFGILIDLVYLIIHLQADLFCKSAFLYRRHDAEWESVLLPAKPFFVMYVTKIWHWDIWERERERERAAEFSCVNVSDRLIKDHKTYWVPPARFPFIRTAARKNAKLYSRMLKNEVFRFRGSMFVVNFSWLSTVNT